MNKCYNEIASAITSIVSVREYISFVYEISDELLDKLIEDNHQQITHGQELQSFAYWTGDKIVDAYNEPFSNEIIGLKMQLNAARMSEDAEQISIITAKIADKEKQLVLPKDGIDTLDDVDNEE